MNDSDPLLAAVFLVGFKEFYRLAVGAGGNAHKVGRHGGGISVLAEAFGEKFLIGETVGKA